MDDGVVLCGAVSCVVCGVCVCGAWRVVCSACVCVCMCVKERETACVSGSKRVSECMSECVCVYFVVCGV